MKNILLLPLLKAKGNLPGKLVLIVSFKTLLLILITPQATWWPVSNCRCVLGDLSTGIDPSSASASASLLSVSLLLFFGLGLVVGGWFFSWFRAWFCS